MAFRRDWLEGGVHRADREGYRDCIEGRLSLANFRSAEVSSLPLLSASSSPSSPLPPLLQLA